MGYDRDFSFYIKTNCGLSDILSSPVKPQIKTDSSCDKNEIKTYGPKTRNHQMCKGNFPIATQNWTIVQNFLDFLVISDDCFYKAAFSLSPIFAKNLENRNKKFLVFYVIN